MLSKFVTENTTEIIARCRERVVARKSPLPLKPQLEHGIPMFIEQLATALRSNIVEHLVGTTAKKHGAELLNAGFTVGQVVSTYGDVCQVVTALAIERNLTFTTQDFQTLNFCLDEAIAGAVTEYGQQRDNVNEVEADSAGAQIRQLAKTALLACEGLRGGSVGIGGATGTLLQQSLVRLCEIAERQAAVASR